MLENASDARKKCEELKSKRKLLFARFLKNPRDTHLALKINIIDDQIAEYTEKMERKKERRK
jgi:hypothetical protein